MGRRRHGVRSLLAGVIAVAAVGAGVLSAAVPESSAATTLAMCGNAGAAPKIQHVVVMYLENAGYSEEIGSSSAPYINNTLTKQCGVATEDFAATHDSAANYLAASAGQFPTASESGCGTVSACSSSVSSIYSQVAGLGTGWRNFVEGATSNCQQNTINNVTKIGHDPGLFYTGIDCADDVVPVASLTTPDTGAFWTELDNNTLPAFTWISPNQTHVGEIGDAVTAQNTFLSQFLPQFVAAAAYQSGTTALIISEDEGSGSDAKVGEACTTETADLAGTQPSCHIPLWIVYPYNPGDNDSAFFDHYSITKTTEDLFGLPYLAHAGDAQTASLVGHFGLTESVASAPPPSSIGFDGVRGTTAGTAKVSVALPTTVHAGDELLLTASAATTAALPAPTGWSLVGREPNAAMTTSVWSKVATATDAGSTVTVTLPSAVKSSLEVSAYSGVSTSTAPSLTGASTHVTATSVSTPTVTVPATDDWVVSYWAIKSSTASTWSSAPGATERLAELGSGGGQITSLLSDSAAPVGAGAVGGLTATSSKSFNASTSVTVVLTPAS